MKTGCNAPNGILIAMNVAAQRSSIILEDSTSTVQPSPKSSSRGPSGAGTGAVVNGENRKAIVLGG